MTRSINPGEFPAFEEKVYSNGSHHVYGVDAEGHKVHLSHDAVLQAYGYEGRAVEQKMLDGATQASEAAPETSTTPHGPAEQNNPYEQLGEAMQRAGAEVKAKRFKKAAHDIVFGHDNEHVAQLDQTERDILGASKKQGKHYDRLNGEGAYDEELNRTKDVLDTKLKEEIDERFGDIEDFWTSTQTAGRAAGVTPTAPETPTTPTTPVMPQPTNPPAEDRPSRRDERGSDRENLTNTELFALYRDLMDQATGINFDMPFDQDNPDAQAENRLRFISLTRTLERVVREMARRAHAAGESDEAIHGLYDHFYEQLGIDRMRLAELRNDASAAVRVQANNPNRHMNTRGQVRYDAPGEGDESSEDDDQPPVPPVEDDDQGNHDDIEPPVDDGGDRRPRGWRQRIRDRWNGIVVAAGNRLSGARNEREVRRGCLPWLVGAAAVAGAVYLNSKHHWVDINPFDGDGFDLNPFNNGHHPHGSGNVVPPAGRHDSSVHNFVVERGHGYTQEIQDQIPGHTQAQYLAAHNAAVAKFGPDYMHVPGHYTTGTGELRISAPGSGSMSKEVLNFLKSTLG